jgi:hypothetical protein
VRRTPSPLFGACIYLVFGRSVGPGEYHRQGWDTDRVRALMDHYRDVHFYNSSLNEMSGRLFMKLRAEIPGRIAPIRVHEDGGYEVDTSWRPGQPD